MLCYVMLYIAIILLKSIIMSTKYRENHSHLFCPAEHG